MHNLLTIAEIADILKISYDKALEIVKYGGLPHIVIGRQYRICEEDLKNYLKKNTKK